MIEEEVLTVLLTRNTAFRNSHNNLKITIYLEYNDKFHLLCKYQELDISKYIKLQFKSDLVAFLMICCAKSL